MPEKTRAPNTSPSGCSFMQDGQPRRIITPFSGVGSEMSGSLLAGWDEATGIALYSEYVGIAAPPH